MITIPKKVEYSILLLSYLSKSGKKKTSLSEVSKRLMLPYRFLGQLAGGLKTAGILTSQEGKTGGYGLVEGWKNKTIYDLLEALGENKNMVKCLGGNDECARAAKCQIKNVWSKIQENFTNDLKKIKLGEI